MMAPNLATLWGRTLVDELAAGGLGAVCIAPGSRSTPLTVAFAAHPDIEVYSHLDERSAAFFAVGRARRTGEPTALVCTSGTAAANFHPAVIEANQARVPLLVLTADRPPELRDSGANQTVDQVKLYGGSVRWYGELPLPEANERALRRVRAMAARALATTTGTPAGPVHVNCPFRKPLEPTPVEGAVPASLAESLAGTGRDGPFVHTARGRVGLEDAAATRRIAGALASADRPLIVAGPADPPVRRLESDLVMAVASASEAPIFADPLSGLRFGSHLEPRGGTSSGATADGDFAVTTDTVPLVCGGYDSYADTLQDPDVVIRFGASPTSKRLRHWLRDADCRQFLIDPAGEWREATFTATDLIAAEPQSVLEGVLQRVESDGSARVADDGSTESTATTEWLETVAAAESTHWSITDQALEGANDALEGGALATVFDRIPDPATVFVSNSMPIRDADRFARPRPIEATVLANRGASGIDGITSTALGAGSATDDPLVCVTGDLAFYHDSNGLLALERCDVDATIVLLDNDGGGIFHLLPIESFDPPFTDQFKTPHGLEFDALEDCYGFEFRAVDPGGFGTAFDRSLEEPGTQVLSVSFDAAASHRKREALEERVRTAIRE